MHRVKSEHCKDDDDDDITDDERKSDQLLNHPGAMQSGNYHRGKKKKKKEQIKNSVQPIKHGWRTHRKLVSHLLSDVNTTQVNL